MTRDEHGFDENYLLEGAGTSPASGAGMTEQDFVAFCNFAFGLRQSAEAFCKAMSDEEVRQLDGLVRMERSATPGGNVEPAYDFLAAVLSEEVELRSAGSAT